jgi:hypothetical protein
LARKSKGAYLNELWGVGAVHSLFLEKGNWFHQLKSFPGAFFDLYGYILFATEQDYRSAEYLQIGATVHIRGSEISALPDYVRKVPLGEKSPIELLESGSSRTASSEPMSPNALLVPLVEEINSRAGSYRIGTLQKIRQALKGMKSLPPKKLFTRHTIKGHYAFHHGGRTELQFNVGIESVDGTSYVRHGVAFSFEPSQWHQSMEGLFEKVSRFNEFLQVHPDLFGDFSMWHWEGRDVRSSDHLPTPIAPKLVRLHVFIFLGKRRLPDAVDVDLILSDFDRLLPLYEFVEGEALFPTTVDTTASFIFTPGPASSRSSTVAEISACTLYVNLRHNQLREALHGILVKKHGAENVRAEHPTPIGVLIDIVLRLDREFWFFEIKTALSARACIRLALAQLLEYAYWPGAQEASRLIIVGEPPLDSKAEMYLEGLRHRFALPVDYQQLDLEHGILKEHSDPGRITGS